MRRIGIQEKVPEIVAGLFLWAIVVLVLFITRTMPLVVEGSPGPRFMPTVIAVVLGMLTCLYWAESFRASSSAALPTIDELARPIGFIVVSLFLALAWERLGAVPTVLVGAVVELRWLEGYRWARSVVVGVSMCVFTWVLFQFVLGIALPHGMFKWLFLR